MPIDSPSIPGSKPETKDKHHETEAADSTIRPSIIIHICWDESSYEENRNRSSSTQPNPQLLGNHLYTCIYRALPKPFYRSRNVFCGDVVGNKSNGNCEPEEKWFQPANIIVMKCGSCDPPSIEKLVHAAWGNGK